MYTAIECKNLLAALNGESLHLEEIEKNLDYYNEHLQMVIADSCKTDEEIQAEIERTQ